MEWWVLLIVGGMALLSLFMSGLPIFLCFLVMNVAGVLLTFGGAGFGMFANSIFETVNSESLTAIGMFIVMGEFLFRSGAVDVAFRACDVLIGQVRGRLFYLSIALSTFMGALSGSAMGMAAMLGRSLYPAMVARGYESKLTIGGILGGASLAPIIPPSILVIIIGALANVSIASLLIAGIVPGLLLSAMFFAYIYVRVRLNSSIAPDVSADEHQALSGRDKLMAFVRVSPVTIIIVMVIGFIMAGVCTPSESAALGAAGAMIAAAIYRTLNGRMIWDAFSESVKIAGMVLVIIASATMFSQLVAFSGVSGKLAEWISSLGFHPLLMLLIMMAFPLIWCMFCDQVALLIVIIPIYQPLLKALDFDPIWFWTMMLLNVTVGGLTPPFGYTMFAFKGSAPNVPLADIFRATWPFVGLFVVAIAIIALFPGVATWLPGLL